MNLIHLDCCIDQKRKIVYANSDDLNGVLQTEGIIDQDDLIDECEDVEREESWNGVSVSLVRCTVIRCTMRWGVKMSLKISKDVSELRI